MREVAERNAGPASEQGSNAGFPQLALIGGFIVSVTVLIYFSNIPLTGFWIRHHKS
jgi:hypothetical protein